MADTAVAESLTDIVLGSDRNQSAVATSRPKTLAEIVGRCFTFFLGNSSCCCQNLKYEVWIILIRLLWLTVSLCILHLPFLKILELHIHNNHSNKA